MARVRQKGTSAELAVRKIVRDQGHDVRVNSGSLPGSPDLFDPTRKLAIFVHGCFWHRHTGCRACTIPTRNAKFWLEKFEQNRSRDQRVVRQLRRLGYRILTVWECQVKTPAKLARLERRLDRFFERS
jgi:DNA mismatch endonuclease (patch repair protein)